MRVETIIIAFNGFVFLLDVFYHIVRLHYERKKLKELEKQTRLMEYYGPEA